MGIIKGGALRLFQTFLYFIIFCCAGVILGIYSYFLSVLADRNRHIPTWEKAVEGLSGAAVLYLIFATILTCCLGGVSFFALLAIVLDLCFFAAMIAIAVMTRHGASSCTGIVHTPLGVGNANNHDGSGFDNDFGFGSNDVTTYAVSPHTACRLNTAAFAVSIIAMVLFLCTAALQVALVRHHKKEKRYGPSPSNNYTSGFGKRKFWQRKPKNRGAKEAELGAGGVAGHEMRPSYETGTTVGNAATYDKPADAPHGAHTGYYTQPTGTGVNPYGYDRPAGTATNY